MSDYTDPNKNPRSFSASLKYADTGPIIGVGSTYYDNIKLQYDKDVKHGGQPMPSTTTIYLTPPSSGTTVSSIQTTKIGNTTQNPPVTWDYNNGKYSYAIAQSYLQQSGLQISFTVNWTDETKHDPMIVINCSN